MSNIVILNCPVTVDDAKRAMLIYGPDLATIKGKTTRGKFVPHVKSFQAVPITAPVLKHHHDVTLCIDFLFVQGQAFLHTISRKLQYRMVTPVNDRTKGAMLKCINSLLLLYRSRVFVVVDIHADVEFECIREQITPVSFNVMAADAHVGEVEQSIRTIKERNRTTINGLPFKMLPRIMVREVVKYSVTCHLF
jgi:hypothetical protein